MAATLDQLQGRLDALKTAVASDTRSVSYGNFRKEYRSLAELQAAIKDVESDIAALQGTAFVRTFRVGSHKGL